MPSTLITASQFWDLYFRNAFLTLERHGERYVGQVYNEPEHAQFPAGFLREMAEVHVEIALSTLRSYNYLADGRFALIARRPIDIDAAYEAITRQTYPYRDPAPFGKQRMAELFTAIRSQWLLNTGTLSLSLLEETLRSMVESHTEELNQPIAALAWFLGERRARSSAKALQAIIANAPFAPFARHRLHFTPIDAAFTALWKVNDKTVLWDMLELLRQTTDAGRRKIAPLFQRLLSTNALQSLERCGNEYFRPEFWASLLKPYSNFTPADWDRYDADSLFWEIRYLAALRVSADDVATARKLAHDEVQTIRDAIGSRFNGAHP